MLRKLFNKLPPPIDGEQNIKIFNDLHNDGFDINLSIDDKLHINPRELSSNKCSVYIDCTNAKKLKHGIESFVSTENHAGEPMYKLSMKKFRKIIENINLNDEPKYEYQKKKLFYLLNNYKHYDCEMIYGLDKQVCINYKIEEKNLYNFIELIKNESKNKLIQIFNSFKNSILTTKEYQNVYFYLKNPIFNDNEIQIKYKNNQGYHQGYKNNQGYHQGYITQIDLINGNFIIDYQNNTTILRELIEYDLENLCIKSDSIFKKYTNCNNELLNKKQNISFSVIREIGQDPYNELLDVIQLGNTLKDDKLQLDTECKILITCANIKLIKNKISEFMIGKENYLKDTIDINIGIIVKGKLFKNEGYITLINILDKTFNVKYDTKLKEVLPIDRIKRALKNNKPELLQQEIKNIPFTQLCITENTCADL